VEHSLERTGTDGMAPAGPVDYDRLDRTPAVIRRGRAPSQGAASTSGIDLSDIPAFLRKQAD
jgi:hypothetical protein